MGDSKKDAPKNDALKPKKNYEKKLRINSSFDDALKALAQNKKK